jgi:hypothetical protein
MNLSHWWFRLWLLGTALWLGAVVYFSLRYFSSPFWANEVGAIALFAVIPPAAAFAGGWLGLWLSGGLRRR